MFTLLQIIIFILIVGILVLPFTVVKASPRTKYIVYLLLPIGLFIIILITHSYNILLIAAIIIMIAGIGRKLIQVFFNNKSLPRG
ncbi:hypothetical protein [Neobacillus sp. D3-1R]|uniref:hypothetical protein n=1 Tax=Neobacillus sp. D3-1R TaxID=3445778 RepID=UPI003FA09506